MVFSVTSVRRLRRHSLPSRPAPVLGALLCLALVLERRVEAQEPLFEFVQISDSQPNSSSDNQNFVDVLSTIAESGEIGALLPRAVDLVLFAGDITDGNSQSEWVAAKTKLDTWLTANGIPFRAVPGNHDVDGSDTSLYEQYIGDSGVWDIGSASYVGHNGLARTTSWRGLRFIGFNNSNPDWNTISAADLSLISARVSAAASAAENAFLLCHHPHNDSSRMPLVNVLPNPNIVGYMRGHNGSPHITKGLAGINNPNIWDLDSNAIYQDRELLYFEVFPTSLRGYVVEIDGSSLPSPVTVPLVHPLTQLSEALYGVAGSLHANARTNPTSESPERKLWQNAGAWWAILWSDSDSAYRIQRLDPSSQVWSDTGTSVSTSAARSFDALAAGNTLYVASNVVSVPAQDGNGSPGQLARFTYSSSQSRYNLDPGFPVALNDARSETLSLARDTTGTLWATWTRGGQVYVNHSVGGNDAAWATPVVLPAASASGLAAEETSALVAFTGKIGVLWPKASAGTVSFALHVDGDPDLVWQTETALSQGALVGDQIDLVADQGRALAVVRAASGALTLLERSNDAPGFGDWTAREAAAASAGLAHPLLVVDQAFGRLRLYATGPTLEGQSQQGGGAIFEKVAGLTALSFPHGRGTPVMQDSVRPSMSFPSASKQAVTAASDLVVLASNAQAERYWHAFNGLTSAPVAPAANFTASRLSGVAPVTVQLTDLSTGTPTDWLWSFGDGTTSSERNPTHVYAAAGTFTVSLRAASGGGEDTLTRTNYITASAPLPGFTFTPVADARVNESNPSTAYGLDSLLRVKTESGSSFQSYLRFDLSSLSGAVQNARLRLYCTDASNSGGSVYTVANNSWSESAITWANKPALAAAPVSVFPAVAIEAWAEVDVTAAISGPGAYSLAIAGGTTNSAFYSSREGTNPPQLVLTLSGSTPAPVADFSATPLTGTAPLSVAFTDLSTNTPTSWTWTFGDGVTSTARNPVHVYSTTGPKTVRLDARNAAGTGTLTRVDYIVVSAIQLAPVANFSASPLAGSAPLSVTFSDLSTNSPTSWTWDFGDGSTSTVRNPVHVYSQVGPKTVRLDARNATGTGTLTRTDYVVVDAPAPSVTFVPVADARVSRASANSNLGTDATLQVRNSGGNSQQSYLRFDLSSLSASVSSARLRLYCTDASNAGGRLYVLTNNSWTETGITWNNKPALPGSALRALGAVAQGTWVEVDVSSAVSGAGVYNFALAAGSGDTAAFSSREGSSPPQLVIQ